MKVGLVARADKTGLATQTWGVWKNLMGNGVRPHKTLVVNLAHCSGQQPDMSLYADDPNVSIWNAFHYPNPLPVPDRTLDSFLDDLDVIFTCETAYNPWLYQRARERGVRSVCQPNFEFLDYLLHSDVPEPDCFALPSPWHEHKIRQALPDREIVYLPVPVDRELLPFRHRTELRTILHTAGTPAMEDRNGTLVLIEAMRYVKSPVTARIRSQKILSTVSPPSNVDIDMSSVERFWQMYGDEDLYIMPRKFGGLCLPLNEALSVGMPVLMSDCSPQNLFLSPDLLISAPVSHEIMTRAMIGVHQVNPYVLAERIDWLYENPETFSELSLWADEWSKRMSWDSLRSEYMKVLEGK